MFLVSTVSVRVRMVHTVSDAITGPPPTQVIVLVAVIDAPASDRVVANVIEFLHDGDSDWLVLKVSVGKPALVEQEELLLSMGLLSVDGEVVVEHVGLLLSTGLHSAGT